MVGAYDDEIDDSEIENLNFLRFDESCRVSTGKGFFQTS